MSNDTPWKNRIIDHGEKAAKDFLANPYNFRIHTALQDKAVMGGLDEIGWVKSVIVNKQTGHLIDGHERVALAHQKGEDTPVPYDLVDLSPQEELIVLAMLDAMAAMAGTERDKLGELLSGITTENESLQEFFGGMAKDFKIFDEDALPPDIFAEFDEKTDYDYCCPKCGYKWSGKPK
jgi:hypothetical protein